MISKRLKSVANFIHKDDKIIDVGCDHALLDIYLADIVNEKIYVSDISSLALDNATKNIKKSHLEEKIIPILGDGLKIAKNIDVDTLLISGMGTATILEIVQNRNMNKISNCILQSNNNHDLLRKYMINHGYKLIGEDVVLDDGHYYVTMKYQKGHKYLPKCCIKFGIHNNIEYYNYLIDKEKQLLKQIPLTHVFLRKKHYKNISDLHKCIIKSHY